jgi:hypothetical protein
MTYQEMTPGSAA